MSEPPVAAGKDSPSRAHLAPLGWVLGGAILTLLIVLVVRAGDAPRPAPTPPVPSLVPLGRPSEPADALGSSRAEFAELYLSYLLNTYYVESRGFCRPLLHQVCLALHRADLLPHAKHCETVPNDELILAIGRYQHRVGLPVDGKAGPETVRMMLGGDFSNRRTMEEIYCRPASPPEPASSASPSASP